MKRQLIPTLALTVTISLPMTGFAADGAALFAKNCKKCHGDKGHGDTAMGERLEIRDYTDPAIQATITDEKIAEVIRDGLTNEDGKKVMLAFGKKLSDDEVQALVEHFRTLAAE